MSEQNLDLEQLKEKAQSLGITFHPSIGAEKLLEKIQEHNAAMKEALDEEEAIDKVVSTGTDVQGLSQAAINQLAARIISAQQSGELDAIVESVEAAKGNIQKERDELHKLVRCRITCMDPAKAAYEGELYAAGNSKLGTVRKFIKFNEPWHVPQIILNVMKEKMYQSFTERKVNGKEVTDTRQVPAYKIEILEGLTKSERERLADAFSKRESLEASMAAGAL